MTGHKYLVIDDDPVVQELIKKAYKDDEKVDVICASNGLEGLRSLYEIKPDLVILDIMMPEMDGWTTCKQIRMVSSVPIIMLTSLSEESNAIRGLDSGADDFIGKPFNLDHLRARIRAVLRRINEPKQHKFNLEYADEHLRVNFDMRTVHVNGQPIDLTRTEYLLLEFFIRNEGRVLSYSDILTSVWGWEYRDSPDYTHVYISHLRRKIEKPLESVLYFHTVYGIGYRFERMAA